MSGDKPVGNRPDRAGAQGTDSGPGSNSSSANADGNDSAAAPTETPGLTTTPPPGTIVDFYKRADFDYGCSFTPTTSVDTPTGEKPIGSLKVGDKVMAYNPKTHKMEVEPVLHVWTHTDNDLIDLTLTSGEQTVQNGKSSTQTSEVVHTTSEHPFLTKEKGFVSAGELKVGMHVLRADGSYGVVTGWKQVPGTKVMYNLEVQQDHTFAVGDGEWVVHNHCNSASLKTPMINQGISFVGLEQAHHVIPCSIWNQGHPLLAAAGSYLPDGGLFPINGAQNGMALTTDRAAALRARQPYHANAPSYARWIGGLMDEMYSYLTGGTLYGPVNPGAAADGLSYIADVARNGIQFRGLWGTALGTTLSLPREGTADLGC